MGVVQDFLALIRRVRDGHTYYLFPGGGVEDGETPDRKFFFGRENMLLARYRRELNVSAMPSTLGEYTSRVVTPELERQKKEGAVAIKFEAAYLRSLDFEPASEPCSAMKCNERFTSSRFQVMSTSAVDLATCCRN